MISVPSMKESIMRPEMLRKRGKAPPIRTDPTDPMIMRTISYFEANLKRERKPAWGCPGGCSYP